MKISEITQMPSQLKSEGLVLKQRKNAFTKNRAYRQEVANLMQLEEQEKEHSEQQYLLGYN
ncbi:hypothetical protein [Pseudoalteromonas sp. PS5]|uniref:hypothetical protein n=1 Tax=Pseudoalteromonas sp. PS5 TaxID=1437473 RepID=UPI000FFF16DB|nr:hypothetical protein [Pseudoalteromonas sp. PS5]RXF05715.1 hypothetical protein D9603_03420 [Pseudoalteromonas sp. PS5]